MEPSDSYVVMRNSIEDSRYDKDPKQFFQDLNGIRDLITAEEYKELVESWWKKYSKFNWGQDV